MNATIVPSEVIDGVYFVHPDSAQDERGRFTEIFREEWVPGARKMVQVNRSESKGGVLRGMHYHLFQADYWYLTQGHAFVALFDFRGASKTAEKVETIEIKDGDDKGIYIPPGVAHGFYSVTDTTLLYMVDQYFDGTDELGIMWSDPALEVIWPSDSPIVNERDQTNPMLADVPEENLPL
jgi:dTDP-4-dehydrorhamnose 3,5-epimerase